jgi:catechol 2,3-dioxygenase-like lactoylglutathione lyase family enzyme
MKVTLTSVMVDDQAKALNFYTNVLGFQKHADIPMGPFRWLTVTSPEGLPGVEVVLEPIGFPEAATFQKAVYELGKPLTAFISNDLQAEYEKLKARGVVFRSEPQNYGTILSAVFEDTCGNLINLVQPLVKPE